MKKPMKKPITFTRGDEYSGEYYFYDADGNLITEDDIIAMIVDAINKSDIGDYP
jgi:hypothetical protein